MLIRSIYFIKDYLKEQLHISSATKNMRTKIVRLKLPSQLLARIKTLELRNHLQNELSKLQHELSPTDTDKLLDNFVFLLSSPLFLYAITPRLRHAYQNLESSQSRSMHDSSAAPAIEARNLAITTEVSNSSYFTQLKHGNATLISIREPIYRGEGARGQSIVWFCEEVEFLACEYGAREEAAAEILGCGLGNSVRSKVVKLKVGRKYLLAKMKMNHNATSKERKVKLRLRLWKDAVKA